MMKRMTLALLGTLLLSLPPVAACTPHAPKDSLSADGPYILYGPGGVDVTGVDVQGDISREHWDRLPDGFTLYTSIFNRFFGKLF